MNSTPKTILATWRDQTVQRLCDGLNLLLDNVGETLVDFAAKSESVDLQTSFFDAQHLLAMRGDTLLAGFREELVRYEEASSAQRKPALGEETLSLLEREAYERSVALETIANNCALRNQQNFHAFKQRMSAIHGGRHFGLDDLPLNPRRVANAYEQAIEPLEIPSRVLLVLFTLFDRYVMAELDVAVSEINQRLAEAGVLPTVKYTIVKQKRDPGEADDEVPEGTDSVFDESTLDETPPAPTAEQTMTEISRLLSVQRRRRAYKELSEPPANYPPVPPQESRRRVNEALDSPQLAQQAANPASQLLVTRDDKVIIDKELLLKVKETLKKQRALINALMGGSRNVAEREQNAIDIVGMLFEAILDDDKLTPQLKTLLSHLHTPYLKIAVNDPGFLQDARHPARLLLDRMLQLGIRWVDPERLRAGVYPTLQYCVRKILDSNGKPDYAHLNQELDRKAAQLEQSKKVAEKRTLDAEKGQTMLARARQTAESATQTLLREHRLPTAVRIFFHTIFTDYLSLLLLRNNLDVEHPGCRDALDAAIQLIESVGARNLDQAKTAGERLQQQIIQLLPHYQDKIGLFLKNLDTTITETPTVEPTPAPTAAEAEEAAEETEAEAPPVAMEGEAPVEDEPIPTQDEEAINRVLNIPVGSWFFLQKNPADQPLMVKLLWSNPHTRNVLFVDQHGLKRARMTLEEAAADLQNGALRPARMKTDGIFGQLLASIKQKLEASIASGDNS